MATHVITAKLTFHFDIFSVHVCGWHAHICGYVWLPQDNLCFLLRSHPPCFLRQALSWVTEEVRLVAQ